MRNKPFLCRVGLHRRYHYLPKVGGDLGAISIACRRCGWGLTFMGKWDIEPQAVQKGIKEQAEIEYGRMLGLFRGVEPKRSMQLAYEAIKSKFTTEELKPIVATLNEVKK